MEALTNISTETPFLFTENTTSNGTSPSVVLSDHILITLGCIMVVENIISILLLYKCNRLIFQIKTLSLNLAVSDLLTGITLVIPNALLYGKYQCDIKKYPAFLFINVSLLIVTMLNLDRCFVFAFAMRYYSYITKKLLVKLCCLFWVLGLVLTYGMFFGYDAEYGFSCELMALSTKNIFNTTFKCILLGLVILNFIMFGYLLYHIRNRLSRVSSIEKSTHPPLEETKIFRKVSVVTGVFLAAFFPFMMIFTFPILDRADGIGKQIYIFSATMVLLNSACNPVFYVWRFSEPRYLMKKVLCCWNKRVVDNIDREYIQQNSSYDIFKTTSSA